MKIHMTLVVSLHLRKKQERVKPHTWGFKVTFHLDISLGCLRAKYQETGQISVLFCYSKLFWTEQVYSLEFSFIFYHSKWNVALTYSDTSSPLPSYWSWWHLPLMEVKRREKTQDSFKKVSLSGSVAELDDKNIALVVRLLWVPVDPSPCITWVGELWFSH